MISGAGNGLFQLGFPSPYGLAGPRIDKIERNPAVSTARIASAALCKRPNAFKSASFIA